MQDPIRLEVKTKVKLLDYTEQSVEIFSTFQLSDSIFGFYPQLSVSVEDPSGAWVETILPIESLELEFKMLLDNSVSEEEVLWEGKYILDRFDLTEIGSKEKINGTDLISFQPFYRKKDLPSSEYYDSKLNTAVKDIIQDTFEEDIKSENVLVSDCSNEGTWYRLGSHLSFILKNWATRAYSSNYPDSPWVTYIDIFNKIHFVSLQELYEQKPIEEFYITKHLLDEDGGRLAEGLDVYSTGVVFSGFLINRYAYNRETYYTEKSGSNKKISSKLEDFYFKKIGSGDRDGKFILEKSNIPEDTTGIAYFTDVEDKDLDDIKGYNNYLNKESWVCYSMTIERKIVGEFKTCAGKTIELLVSSNDIDEEYSPEYSGKWLILSSTLLKNRNGLPIQVLEIAKPSLDLKLEHPLSKLLI